MDQGDWLGGFECERREDASKSARLVNVIGKLPGARDYKLKWLEANMPLLEAEASREGAEPGSRAFGARVVSLTYRFYRHHVLKLRASGKGVPRESELPQNVVALADRIGRKS